MNNQVIGGVSDEKTFGTLSDVCFKIGKGVLTPDHLKRFANKQNPFVVETIDSEIVFWTGLYSVVFDIDARKDLLALHWPEPNPDFWDVPMVEGLSEQMAQNALKCWGKFPVGSYYDDLDAVVKENDRHPGFGTYGIRFRALQEADDDQKNVSANQHKAKTPPTQGNTLLERQVLEPMYFLRSGGDHLDKENVTHCIGSRFADGYVPRVCWRGLFYVSYGFHPDVACPCLRACVLVWQF